MQLGRIPCTAGQDDACCIRVGIHNASISNIYVLISRHNTIRTVCAGINIKLTVSDIQIALTASIRAINCIASFAYGYFSFCIVKFNGRSTVVSGRNTDIVSININLCIVKRNITGRFVYMSLFVYTFTFVDDASLNIADIQGAILHSQACIRALMTVDTCFRITDIQRAAILDCDLIPAGNANTGMRRLLCIVLHAVYR